ncbi:unnamed protein product [Didymodactylos carnosus]|uniref:NAD(+)--protein-arginine ADP-ribosyltransferase n=1 Tax=Didymodactylos carnosus TaxID=1234261 RepID=A0A815V0Q7_9BILA|nr:unnamed protein product [Didymodactylos carnosus]CAF4380671.1 unnamed protein product [Didymodactylos carnosus]
MKQGKTKEREEQKILRNPQQGEASAFYWACRNGNIELVKELVTSISYENLNRLEPNGSTALHAATFYGQADIVHLLLHERGCRRDLLNLHGLTAYEEATSDKIRQLFHRPNNVNRFCDESDEAINMFEVSRNEDADSDKDIVCDNWVYSSADAKKIAGTKEWNSAFKTLYQSKVGRKFDEKFGYIVAGEDDIINHLTGTVREHLLLKPHRQFEKCMNLLALAAEEHKPEPLLRLYTLETPFYRALNKGDARHLQNALYRSLDKLKPRYFQGTSYRGVKMTKNDLRVYRWASKKHGTIWTRTFSSTSLERSVAEQFAGTTSSADKRQSVLMIFRFPEKCDTAINLGKLSPDLPCISEYENEAEVLLLPFTYFTLSEVKTESQPMIIYLENAPVKNSWLAVLKNWGPGAHS